MLSRGFQIDNVRKQIKEPGMYIMVNSIVEFLGAISFMIDVKACTKVHSDNNFSSFTLQSHNPILFLKS